MPALAKPAVPWRPLVVLGTIVLVIVVLTWAQLVVIPFVLALLLTFILTTPVKSLQNRGVPRVPAVLLVMLITVLLMGGLVLAISLQVQDLIEEIPTKQNNLAAKVKALRGDGT